MALFGDAAKGIGGAGPALLIGAGVLILGPRLLRMAARATRPIAKTAVTRVARSVGAARGGAGDMVEESRAETKGRGEAPRKPPRSRAAPKRAAPKRSRAQQPGPRQPRVT